MRKNESPMPYTLLTRAFLRAPQLAKFYTVMYIPGLCISMEKKRLRGRNRNAFLSIFCAIFLVTIGLRFGAQFGAQHSIVPPELCRE